MPRHYTDEEKRLVLDRLIANHGDVARTADDFHLTTTTIYRWMKAANVQQNGQLQLQQMQHFQLSESSSSPPSLAGEGPGVGVSDVKVLPEETTEAFQILHDKLLTLINTLSNRIEEAIDEAPLNQRVTALSQLMNTVSKIAAMLPEEEQEIEYVHEYEYEVEHHVEKKEETEEDDYHSSSEDQGESPTPSTAYQSAENFGE